MHDPAATLDLEGKPNPNAITNSDPIQDEAEQADGQQPAVMAGRRGMKFSYPSGSKPLDGYTIKRGIGIGGFGEVYFALSEAGKEVALKRIQRNLDVELRGVRQCLNLKHVNLITLWDIRTNDHGESWVVMEYVPGPSLRDVVESHPGGMPSEDLKTWFVSTAAGCAYLHEHGIVHRDLKPGNIFRDEHEQVIKIGDYGLSKFISCSRRSGQTESVGTFHYMAPEIGKGVYGKEIDIYALGIILFEMLTGEVPFEGESTQEIIMKHLTTDPDVDRVPLDFRKVIRKALRKDPELRYRSVPEMLADTPWPEVAANSQKIVSQHSVGPMVASAKSDQQRAENTPTQHHGAPAEQKGPIVDAAVLPNGTQLPPVIVNTAEVRVVQPDIVFGQLKDTSHAGQKNGSQSTGMITVDEDPIQVVPQQAAFAKATTVPGNPTIQAEEPIARAVQTGFVGVGNWWQSANVSIPVKILALVVASIVVVKNSEWLLPLALGLGFIYLVYYVTRNWLQATANEAENQPKQPTKREIKAREVAQLREWNRGRIFSDRATELLGSLLIGALACMVFNLLGLAIGGSLLNMSIESWALYAWLCTISITASWLLLFVGKNWERREGKQAMRRLSLSAIGLIIGAMAFFTAGTFGIDLSDATRFNFSSETTSQFVLRGVPMLPAYLIFFAGLFGILRWWRQVDPTRSTRLSMISVSLCLIWATVFSHVLEVPMTPNCILAVVISVSVQLAAPWLSPQQRQEICSEQVGSD